VELGQCSLESLGVILPGLNRAFWQGRRVFLTGHTGFKGSWLGLILNRLGAVTTGYALSPPPDGHNLFDDAKVARHLRSVVGDIRDLSTLRAAASAAEPEIILHLAAQSLVLPSYEAPLETFSTNVMGTANVLQIARDVPSVRAVVVVTSDKVYRNREWTWGYRENDELGGQDPYSSSKACAEMVSASFRASFLAAKGIATATARAGNVIGGGDWAFNRLVPDFVRAVLAKKPVIVRNPDSTRPWQHVLEPLEGYLILGERLVADRARWEGAWNFGPPADAIQPVGRLVSDLVARWGEEAAWVHERTNQPHEATLLTLDATKARQDLGWSSRLGYAAAVQLTIDWYKAFGRGEDLESTTLRQIDSYFVGA